MKKIVSILSIFFLCIFGASSMLHISHANCNVSDQEIKNLDISNKLSDCLAWSDLVDPGDWMIETGIKAKLVYWTTQLGGLLWLLAVGAIVYGGLMMTLSWGEDEKVKKWKDIVKWAMLWFLAVIAAGWVVRLIVEVMFSVAW